jgi:ABC-type transport system involved in multi-copper enzyme maturation permease subunit
MTAVPAETLDLSGTSRISFLRLVRVEMRKMVDTRAGMWLLISIGLVTALFMVIQIWVSAASELHTDFHDFMIGMNTPMAILLPILGILGVTQEWSQRTALVSFTLVPSRLRLFGAKFAGLVVWAAIALVVGLGLAAVSNLIFAMVTGDAAVWNVGLGDLGGFFLAHALGLATGFAFGALFLNSPFAIVIYFVYLFVLPGLFGVGAAFLDWFAKVQPWIDFNSAQAPLASGSVSGEQWAQLLVSGAIWLGLPLVFGLRRVLRSEVK